MSGFTGSAGSGNNLCMISGHCVLGLVVEYCYLEEYCSLNRGCCGDADRGIALDRWSLPSPSLQAVGPKLDPHETR